MSLTPIHNEAASHVYGGDPVGPLEDLQSSSSVARFGNADLASSLGLKLNMAAPQTAGLKSTWEHKL